MLQEERLILPHLHVGEVETNGALAVRELVPQEQSVTGGSDLQTSHMSAPMSVSCKTCIFQIKSKLALTLMVGRMTTSDDICVARGGLVSGCRQPPGGQKLMMLSVRIWILLTSHW